MERGFTRFFRNHLVSTASVAVIALANGGAFAQGATQAQQSEAASGLEELIVSARRVEENIQTVPIAVTVMSEEELQTRGITDTLRLQVAVPAFNSAAGNRGAYAWIRGLQGIAGYYADAPFPIGRFGQQFDIANFQVLKGPQGTLFGQSSASGAIVSNPVKPTNEVTGFVSARGGSYHLRALQGAINIPLVEDKVLTRIAVDTYARKGYVRDIKTGKDYGNEDYFTIRPSIVINPTDTIENYTVFNYYYSRNNGRSRFLFNYMPSTLFNTLLGSSEVLIPGAAANNIILSRLAGNQADYMVWRHTPQGDLGEFKFDGLTPSQGFSGEKDRHIFIVNKTSWDALENLTLTNILSYYRAGTRSSLDNYQDGFYFNVANDPRAVAARMNLPVTVSWANETKAEGTLFDDMVDYTLGVIQQGTAAPTLENWGFSRNFLTANLTKAPGRTPSFSRGVYGQAKVNLSEYVLEGLTFTAGYRNTWDTLTSFRADLVVTPNTPTSQLNASRVLYLKSKFSYDNFLLGLQYQMDPDTMFYFTGSKGVTGGQVNPVNPVIGGVDTRVLQPETLTQLEGGFKLTAAVGDVEFRSNLSAYYGWYKNVQVTTVIFAQVTPPPAPPTSLTVSQNAAQGLTRGVDLDVEVIPAEWLHIGGALVLNRNKFTRWPTASTITGLPIDRSNTPFLGAPRIKYTVNGTVYLPIPEDAGRLSIRADYSASPKTYYYDITVTNANQVPFTVLNAANGYGPFNTAGIKRDANAVLPYDLLDLSANWEDVMNFTGLDATFSVTNVTNQNGHLDASQTLMSNGVKSIFADPPRMFTLGLKYSF